MTSDQVLSDFKGRIAYYKLILIRLDTDSFLGE